MGYDNAHYGISFQHWPLLQNFGPKPCMDGWSKSPCFGCLSYSKCVLLLCFCSTHPILFPRILKNHKKSTLTCLQVSLQFPCSKYINSVLFPCLFLILGFTAAHKWGTCLGTRAPVWTQGASAGRLLAVPRTFQQSQGRHRTGDAACAGGGIESKTGRDPWVKTSGDVFFDVSWGGSPNTKPEKRRTFTRTWGPILSQGSSRAPSLRQSFRRFLWDETSIGRTHRPTRIHQKWHKVSERIMNNVANRQPDHKLI